MKIDLHLEITNDSGTCQSIARALVTLQADRQTTAVALIQSLGGGW